VVAPVENRGRTDDEDPIEEDKPSPAVKAVDGGPGNLLESFTSEPIGTSKI
jgi:hypothetical protein